jgi:hypothetical protein
MKSQFERDGKAVTLILLAPALFTLLLAFFWPFFVGTFGH